MAYRFPGHVRFQVLFADVGHIFGFLVLGEEMIKRLIAQRTYVFRDRVPPFFRIAEGRIDIENHAPEGVNPVPDDLANSEFCRSHGYSSAYCMHCRDTVSAACVQAL
ncbi:hypothetical protein SIAM614_14200 [Stappia aggregata IAM 12614]|uniref:Uncharacterized protein n=1 Tax=Roseibium aggregatum (strain ATCC 25650 / DSM 13394 / JCM 20685 / NBRC 16684 / NCIMB 2208 / IAM 12614 / B1) TaxID=384765 RepID=A0NSM5_ROSAI|nr:hypothetical protein SIAM614_14200 [Stappia aggregata IAM 12614] [Roseibium aggregatum IAM 12614]